MSADLQPRFEARVSPELIQYRGVVSGARALLPTDRSVPVVNAVQTSVGQSDGCGTPDFQPILLRRDGARPLNINGTKIFQVEDAFRLPGDVTISVSRTFALFLCANNICVAAIQLEPSDDCPARPVSNANVVATIDDVLGMLHTAVSAFLVSSATQEAEKLIALGTVLSECPPHILVSANMRCQ